MTTGAVIAEKRFRMLADGHEMPMLGSAFGRYPTDPSASRRVILRWAWRTRCRPTPVTGR
jgi:hypothetical protein